MSSELCPHVNLGPLVLNMQEASPNSAGPEPERKDKIPGVLAAKLLH